jgi:hypothetical protein
VTRTFGAVTVPAVRLVDPGANLYYEHDSAGEPLVPRATTVLAAIGDARTGGLTVRTFRMHTHTRTKAHASLHAHMFPLYIYMYVCR